MNADAIVFKLYPGHRLPRVQRHDDLAVLQRESGERIALDLWCVKRLAEAHGYRLVKAEPGVDPDEQPGWHPRSCVACGASMGVLSAHDYIVAGKLCDHCGRRG